LEKTRKSNSILRDFYLVNYMTGENLLTLYIESGKYPQIVASQVKKNLVVYDLCRRTSAEQYAV
jgi:hypothetical protein